MLLVDPVMSCKLSLIIGICGCSAVIYTVIYILYFIKVCFSMTGILFWPVSNISTILVCNCVKTHNCLLISVFVLSFWPNNIWKRDYQWKLAIGLIWVHLYSWMLINVHCSFLWKTINTKITWTVIYMILQDFTSVIRCWVMDILLYRGIEMVL